MKDIAAIVLAAGKGTRMREGTGAKVLRRAAGKPLLEWVLSALEAAGLEKIFVVVGHDAPRVMKEFGGRGLIFVPQKSQLGTGHAVDQCRDALSGFFGDVLIVCGDTPLITGELLDDFIGKHRAMSGALTVLTVKLDDPTGYGRIVRNETGGLLGIVEEKDADEKTRLVREVNTGLFAVDAPFLFRALERVDNRNVQGEYYLTDIVKMGHDMGAMMFAAAADDPALVLGVNTEEELEIADRTLAERGGSCAE
jgi:bifunctional UDP-N-acetylglucosamine pyrophosphorylase/glucosamine-1-phosphate N-acetyltransferase